MNFKTYYFNFNSPLHIGNHRPEGYEQSETILHSDTITAAVLSTWARLGHEDWIIEGDGDPGFTISSAFPYVKSDGKFTHFFPKPLIPFNRDFNPDISKPLKKVTWLDQDFFEAVISQSSTENLGEQNQYIQGEYLSSHIMKGSIIRHEIQERVVVPRNYEEDSDARPFSMERLRFEDDAGLYILVKNNNERLKLALELLQYEGFGTDRSVGNGMFELEEGELELSTPVDSEFRSNLGLYCPESHELLSQQLTPETSHHLIKRGGWITTEGYQSLEKNSVHMFGVGSVLKVEKELSGIPNLNLKPPSDQITHKIYRSGRSIFVPVKIGCDE